ncbi:MAG: autotransporter outer membrane beta-barrel domain-containing protein [Bacteroidales bacterium]|nr:autotransporter outer membrane beta-barrel domain-containing protein [Bacteroidales bacterium]
MKYFYILPMLLFFVQINCFAQDIPVKQKKEIPEKQDSLELKTAVSGAMSTLTDSLKPDQLPLRLPRLNPAENLLPQFTPYQKFTLSPQQTDQKGIFPPIYWNGTTSDFITAKSRTAIASMMPSRNLMLHSSTTLGLVETPMFGKSNFYILDAGANYMINPALMMGISGGYNSNFNMIPFWNIGINASYQMNHNLMFDGGVSYLKSAGNLYNVNQSAMMIDLHSRYRLNDDWYVNAYGGLPVMKQNNQPNRPMMPMMNTSYYGGSVEYWFKPTMGVEGGMIWMRDMYSGKMRAQPKLELLFRPGKK